MSEVGTGVAARAGAQARLADLAARLADEGRFRTALWALLGLGLLVRLLLAATTTGSVPDLNAFRGVHAALSDDPLRFYSEANPEPGRYAWPYMTGYLPVVELLYRVESATSIPFERLIRLPPIAADLAIAWIVQWHLGWRGAAAGTRLAACALIVLSPVGIAMTSAHGQIDPVEWLPVVLAVVAWERLDGDRRVAVAGALVGLGAAIKPPAAIAGLALLALTAGWRERAILVAAGAAVPLLVMAPFVLADADGALGILDYQSVAGQGGLSLLVQPELAMARFAGSEVGGGFNVANDVLQDLAPILVALACLTVAAVARRRRFSADAAIATLALAVFVVSPNFLPLYLIWLVPFAVLAGWWRFLLATFALSLFLLPFKYLPGSVIEATGLGQRIGLWDEWIVAGVYIPFSIVLWLLLAGRLAGALRR